MCEIYKCKVYSVNRQRIIAWIDRIIRICNKRIAVSQSVRYRVFVRYKLIRSSIYCYLPCNYLQIRQDSMYRITTIVVKLVSKACNPIGNFNLPISEPRLMSDKLNN